MLMLLILRGRVLKTDRFSDLASLEASVSSQLVVYSGEDSRV